MQRGGEGSGSTLRVEHCFSASLKFTLSLQSTRIQPSQYERILSGLSILNNDYLLLIISKSVLIHLSIHLRGGGGGAHSTRMCVFTQLHCHAIIKHCY